MKRHFVKFYSPGTMFAEETEKPIDSWDIATAKKMAKDIVERYGARPYGFTFSTRERKANELDSSVTATSPMHFLGGKVETLAQVKARATKDDAILISNMECNGWNRIISGVAGYKWTQPLGDKDVVVA